MKILPNSVPEPVTPAPEPVILRVEPASAPTPEPANDAHLKAFLEDFAQHAMAEVRDLQKKFEQTQAQGADRAEQNSKAIAKLIDEVAGLKTAVADMRIAAAKELPITPPPPPQPPAPQELVIPPDLFNSVTREIARVSDEVSALRKAIADFQTKAQATPPISQPEPVAKPVVAEAPLSNPLLDDLVPERKVAFLSKLWDYLNQVAFEIPLRGDRNR